MGDLQDIGRDHLTERPPPHQLSFPIRFEIAWKQQRAASEGDAQNQRGVVDRKSARRADVVVEERSQRVDPRAAERDRHDLRRRNTAPSREIDQPVVLGVAPVVAARPERADRESVEDSKQPAQMIWMGVGERDDLEAGDPPGSQEGLDDTGTGVEQAVPCPAPIYQHDGPVLRRPRRPPVRRPKR